MITWGWPNPLDWAANRVWYWLATKVLVPDDLYDLFDEDDIVA